MSKIYKQIYKQGMGSPSCILCSLKGKVVRGPFIVKIGGEQQYLCLAHSRQA